jgi:hypothetical protein
MTIEFGLGRFGDRRLEKGGPPSTLRLLRGPAVESDALPAAGRRKCGSGAFCAIAL